jgi:hypothetical protein
MMKMLINISIGITGKAGKFKKKKINYISNNPI